MARLNRSDAREILARVTSAAQEDATRDFHALSSGAVAALLAEADRHGYRAPRNANGSRARCFHSYLSRLASRPLD
jgi:hypothetical protein